MKNRLLHSSGKDRQASDPGRFAEVSYRLTHAMFAAVGILSVLASNEAWAGTRQFDTVVVNKVDGVVDSFDVNFIAGTASDTNTLFFAYGETNGGDTTNGWEHVEQIAYVMPSDLTRHVVAPAGFGSELFYARFFLADGMAIPYDTRYESYTRKDNAYIDTGFCPNQNTRVVADLTVNGIEFWFGCWSLNYSSGAFAIRWENATQVYIGNGNCDNASGSGVNIVAGKRYVIDFNNDRKVTMRDASADTLAFPVKTFSREFKTDPQTLYLYAFNQAGSLGSGGATTLHSCKIYDDGRLVRDFIPVSKGGTAYLFDVANCVLYPFKNGGQAAPGAVVENDPYAIGIGPISAVSELVEVADIREFVVVRWDPSATGSGDGKSWANACTDFGEAIARAGIYKGEVWIKGGTNEVHTALTLKNNVAVLGGFEGRDGVYADDDEERAARNPDRYRTVFASTNKTHVDLNGSGAVDATAVVDGISFRNKSGGAIVNATTAGGSLSLAAPTFTNCTFAGGMLQLQMCAPSFLDCRFEALTGGSYGHILIENGSGKVKFDGCAFVSVTNNTTYGLIRVAGGNGVSFNRCRFEDCVGLSVSGPATISKGGAVDTLQKCVFARCRSAGYGITDGVAMMDCRFEGCSNTGAPLFSVVAGRMERTAFVGNTVNVNKPDVTSGINHVGLLNIKSARTTLVNCTFDGNVCEAIFGDGATAVRSTVCWANQNALGGAVNCTFRNNAVDHDLTACGISSGNDVHLVNIVTSNTNAGYRAIRTFDSAVGGFCVYSSYLQGFDCDQEYAYLRLFDDIRTDDPRCERKFVDEGTYRVIRLCSDSSANRHRGRNVEVGANGVLRYKDANGDYIYAFNDQIAPTEPVMLLGDMLGNERADGQFVPGSCQLIKVNPGLCISIR